MEFIKVYNYDFIEKVFNLENRLINSSDIIEICTDRTTAEGEATSIRVGYAIKIRGQKGIPLGCTDFIDEDTFLHLTRRG